MPPASYLDGAEADGDLSSNSPCGPMLGLATNSVKGFLPSSKFQLRPWIILDRGIHGEIAEKRYVTIYFSSTSSIISHSFLDI